MKSIYRSILARSLMTGAASLAVMTIGPPGVRAETVIGAIGPAGANCPDLFAPDLFAPDRCDGGNAGDGESVGASENPATAIGGNGGMPGFGDVSGFDGNGGAGGSGTALAMGSSGLGNVTVSALAMGGGGGVGLPDSLFGGPGGDARANSVQFVGVMLALATLMP